MNSILTVVTPAATHDLTSLATVKDELKITDRDSDTTLRRYIREASAVIEGECGRIFAVEGVSELWRASGGWNDFRCFDRGDGHLRLRRGPIVSIDSVIEDDGIPLTADDYEIDADLGWLWRMSGQTSGTGGRRCRWHACKLVVAYTGGYETVPYELDRACQILVEQRWNDRGRDPNLIAHVVPGVLERRWWRPAPGESALPEEVIGMIGKYREVTV